MTEDLSLSERIARIVAAIPVGKVATYGQIAAMAGHPLAARQVVRVLKVWAERRGLPWHRVINREGRISLRPGDGFEEQTELLESEGVAVGLDGRVDLRVYQWPG